MPFEADLPGGIPWVQTPSRQSGRPNGNVGDKPETAFWKSLERAPILCGISPHAAELADRNAGGLVKVAKAFAGPWQFAQCRRANHFPGTFQQDLEQLQRLLL